MEHEEQGEKLESELERLEEHSDDVGEQIDETRREWEAKEDDPAVPGAQPDQLPEEDQAGA
jgi:septal ring factor EnvC (AmiA/AmiB activator)